MRPRLVAIRDAALEVSDRGGGGEPVVLVQTALTADELLPLASDPAFDAYRTIVYHRRGYAGSSSVNGPGSIVRDARDCAELLGALDVGRAHIVGFSFSGAVALQLAASAADLVHSLALIEPPPVHTPSAGEFRAANDRLTRTRLDRGPDAALDEFLGTVMGPRWREVTETLLPGSGQQMAEDARTFFDTDLPALLAWEFGPTEVAAVTCPVLHVGGDDSGPWFAEVRELMLAWFPHAEDVVIGGADHGLPLTHAATAASAIAAFVGRHPMQSASDA